MTETAVRRYYSGFDYLRGAAILGVVCIHGFDLGTYVRIIGKSSDFAVPCFIMMSIFLEFKLHRGSDAFGEFVGSRFKRLALPYLFWSGAYVLMRILKQAVLHEKVLHWDWLYVIFCGGSAYQMWFLATLFYLSILAYPLCRTLGRSRPWAATAGLALIGVGGVYWYPELFALSRNSGAYCNFLVVYFWRMLPFFAFALLWGRYDRWLWERLSPAFRISFRIGGFVLAVALLLSAAWAPLGFWALAVGACLLFVVFSDPDFPSAPSAIRWCAQRVMAIYLLHGFFIEGGQALCKILKCNDTQPVIAAGILAGALGGSLLICRLLKCSKYTRWMI